MKYCRCGSGKFVPKDRECDLTKDCLSGADEISCNWYGITWIRTIHRVPAPAIINLLGDGYTSVDPWTANMTCSNTHFPCPSEERTFCLPVYVRCNGVKDCSHGEVIRQNNGPKGPRPPEPSLGLTY